MSKIYLGIGLALVLVFCGAASAATIPVNQLSGNFQGTNPSVASTNDGVQFGPYADGGTDTDCHVRHLVGQPDELLLLLATL